MTSRLDTQWAIPRLTYLGGRGWNSPVAEYIREGDVTARHGLLERMYNEFSGYDLSRLTALQSGLDRQIQYETERMKDVLMSFLACLKVSYAEACREIATCEDDEHERNRQQAEVKEYCGYLWEREITGERIEQVDASELHYWLEDYQSKALALSQLNGLLHFSRLKDRYLPGIALLDDRRLLCSIFLQAALFNQDVPDLNEVIEPEPPDDLEPRIDKRVKYKQNANWIVKRFMKLKKEHADWTQNAVLGRVQEDYSIEFKMTEPSTRQILRYVRNYERDMKA